MVGRPKGLPKTGGRKPGSRNRLNELTRKKAENGGILPLDYMLEVMRDKNASPERRDDMAKAAGPYCSPKLTAIEHSGNVRMTHEMALKQLEED